MTQFFRLNFLLMLLRFVNTINERNVTYLNAEVMQNIVYLLIKFELKNICEHEIEKRG